MTPRTSVLLFVQQVTNAICVVGVSSESLCFRAVLFLFLFLMVMVVACMFALYILFVCFFLSLFLGERVFVLVACCLGLIDCCSLYLTAVWLAYISLCLSVCLPCMLFPPPPLSLSLSLPPPLSLSLWLTCMNARASHCLFPTTSSPPPPLPPIPHSSHVSLVTFFVPQSGPSPLKQKEKERKRERRERE